MTQPLEKLSVADTEGKEHPNIPQACDDHHLRGILEALLLVVDTPASVELLAEVTKQSPQRITRILHNFAEELTARNSGMDLRQTDQGWRLYTRACFSPYVEHLLQGGARSQLTRAALETLAVIAYRQPVTRAHVSAIRGVNSDGVIRTLLARGLIAQSDQGHHNNAAMFVTTKLFLELLGLSSLEQLPDIIPLLPDIDAIEDLVDPFHTGS